MPGEKIKFSIYQKAMKNSKSLIEYYIWERSRCIGFWLTNSTYHCCGLEPNHKGKCICRHCGKRKPK